MDHIPKAVKGQVKELLTAKNQRENMEWVMTELDLHHIAERDIGLLSGGELQVSIGFILD